jgi:RNA polymerase sigma-70 factor, ECF subfamily
LLALRFASNVNRHSRALSIHVIVRGHEASLMPDLPQDSPSLENSPSREDLLNDIIASYFEAVERRETADPRAYIERHPAFAAELALFFDDRANIFADAGDSPRDASSASTSTSLLARVKANEADAWSKLSRLYGTLVYRWARRTGLQANDAADVVQEVFSAVSAHMSEFRRERPSDSFRGWLFSITRNKIRDHFRRGGAQPMAEGGSEALSRMLAVPDRFSGDEGSLTGASAHADLTHRIVEMVRAEFPPHTWQAFWHTAVDGRPAADVAGELGIKVSAVYVAMSRVLARLRHVLVALGDG